ncbi:hypothetical protein [Bradyrhizobium sp. AUGA SZCCT0431]|uniref:hypothetical protein n=1 Tax=Bradyrhizobium sp. AUGA SZCCT0431 TaxID=2807674 RepID=UPI001BA9B99E|nr:hypothetical protein [Bradyrhizobium sp. AUGA SZCCT0431]MBR1147271.1 hypothetical protein [Bradyrhizobium sp. AUGA SZCCT0431]
MERFDRIRIHRALHPARRSGKKPGHQVQKDGAQKVHPHRHYQQYQPKESSREKLLFGPDNKRDSFRPLQHFGALCLFGEIENEVLNLISSWHTL